MAKRRYPQGDAEVDLYDLADADTGKVLAIALTESEAFDEALELAMANKAVDMWRGSELMRPFHTPKNFFPKLFPTEKFI